MKEKFMKIAIKESVKALKYGEIPVGAVIVYNNKVIAKGYNKKESSKNCLKHAELIAIDKACKKIGDWRLNNCEMYVTMEPCYMCMGAIIESRINKLYCGVKNTKSHLINKKVFEQNKIIFEYNIMSNEIEKNMEKCFLDMRNKQNKCS